MRPAIAAVDYLRRASKQRSSAGTRVDHAAAAGGLLNVALRSHPTALGTRTKDGRRG